MNDFFYIRNVPIFSEYRTWCWDSKGLGLNINTYKKITNFVLLLRKIRYNGKGDY